MSRDDTRLVNEETIIVTPLEFEQVLEIIAWTSQNLESIVQVFPEYFENELYFDATRALMEFDEDDLNRLLSIFYTHA